MPNLIDKQQLQATAQVAKSYILEQDTANVNTIINALQQSSTPAPAATKTEPELSINDFDGERDISITYNGDGELFIYGEYTSVSQRYAIPLVGDLDRSDKVIRNFYERLPDDPTSATLWVHATEGTNYAAKTVSATCTF